MDLYSIFSRRTRPITAAIQQHQPNYDHLLEPRDTVLHMQVQVKDKDSLSVFTLNLQPPTVAILLNWKIKLE